MELHQLLPPSPSSARAARRFAADALREYRHDELTEVATLLVSELVTNALLHAGSQIGVRLRLASDVVRVEVRDASPVLPLTRTYDDEATTGRGLEMVELLAADWGVEPLPGGKIVWFEIAVSGRATATETATADSSGWEPLGETTAPAETALQPVSLLGAPVRLCRATQQHVDALLRERMLIGLGDQSGGEAEPAAVPELAAAVSAQLQLQLDGAAQHGAADVDATLRLSADARDASRQLAAHLDQADDMARRGALLTSPALPEIRACRHWILDQVATQLAGAAPTPWTQFHDPEQPSRDLWTLVEHTPILDQLGDAVIVADDENRIVHANPAVERLLGWPRGDLVGERVTVIIPERLREAHIAGYTRYLVTRHPHLLGRPARMPARHRDGRDIPIELLLTTFQSPDGRPAFVASMRSVDERDAEATPEPAEVETARAVRAVATALSERRDADLATAAAVLVGGLGDRLRWQFGAVWVDDRDGLRCAHVWASQPDRYASFARHTRAVRLRHGDGLPGRAWKTARVVWISDIAADAGFVRGAAAVEHGLRTGVALPVVAGGRVIAVAELYSSRARSIDPATEAVLEAAGALVGALVGR